MRRGPRCPLGFGTWALGGRAYGPVPEVQAHAAIEAALDHGVRLFDTADIYGDGRAEQILGIAIAGVPDVAIVSKGGYLAEGRSDQNFSHAYLRDAAERSLTRLRQSELNTYLLHSPPEEVLERGEAFDALDRLRDAGLVRKTGVSLRTFDRFPAVLRWKGCNVVETVFNLLDQRFLDSGFLDEAHRRDIDVIARAPLCFGLLSGKHRAGAVFLDPDQRSRWSRLQIDRWISATESFRFLEHTDRSMTQAALAFCIQAPGITWTIPGMKNCKQVEDALAARDQHRLLTRDEIAAARQAWRLLTGFTP